MSACIFCKIEQGELPANIIYEDKYCLAFDDINPKASVHFLVIPRKHIINLDDLQSSDKELVGHIMLKLAAIAKSTGLTHGFRTVIHTGVLGGQEVDHLHVHILGNMPNVDH